MIAAIEATMSRGGLYGHPVPPERRERSMSPRMKHRRRREQRWILALVMVAAVVLANAGRADAEVTLNFTPMLTELTVTPGSVNRFDVVMENNSKVGVADILIYTADVEQKPNGEYRLLPAGQSPYSCSNWIKLSSDRAQIGPSEVFAATATLTVPRGASGGRYGAIVFEMVPEEWKDRTAFASTAFVQRFVSIVEVTVPARNLKSQLDVTGFTASAVTGNPSYVSKYGPNAIILSAQVENTGTIHVFARGSLILRDSAGKRLREIPLGGGRGIVLPRASISISSILPSGLAPGNYIADISIKYGGTRPANAKVSFVVGGRETEVAEAQSATQIAPFSVDPAAEDLTYPAGATAARSLVIENRSDQTIRVEGRAMALAFDEEGELVTGDVAPSESSCAHWIELRPNIVEIKPRSRQVVRMIIAIPKGESGGKYANVVFTASQASAEKGQAWSGESGTVVFLRVGKEFNTLGKIDPITIDDGGPSIGTVFGTVFENIGTIHVKPRASIAIKKRVMPESIPGVEYVGPGSLVEVKSLDLGEEENVVLPGGKRLFSVALSGGLEPGDYVVEFLVTFGGKSPLYVMREFTVK